MPIRLKTKNKEVPTDGREAEDEENSCIFTES